MVVSYFKEGFTCIKLSFWLQKNPKLSQKHDTQAATFIIWKKEEPAVTRMLGLVPS